ncbi:ABC transporter permease [Anaeromyxobacter oryzisoli]|uniref:ABC transporter permease n=1 Tax=Anaeromyxobacter oryzisoli TaxID=2925408 RepID=UPI001F580816|nr:FtsX-like permease family protein [Anaeromyxobacter sp. SG63]
MLSAKLAFRNMLAHRQRSRIMFVVIGLVSFVVFLFMAFSDGQLHNFKTGVIALTDPAADVVVSARGFKTAAEQGEDFRELSSHSVEGYPAVLRELRALPYVKRAATPTTPVPMNLVAHGLRHENFTLRGVDPDQAYLVREHLRMKEGSFFGASDEPEIILHYKTASTTHLRPGDAVTLSGKNLFGQVVVQQARFKGYFVGEQDIPNLAELGFVNMAAYRLVSGFAPHETLSLFVELRPGEGKAGAIQKLGEWAAERGFDLEFWDYDRQPRSTLRVHALMRVYDLLRLILQSMSVVVLTIVTFGIMSVVSVNLQDRRREIGTYYCLGSEKGFLIRLYTLELLMINLAAAVAGVLAGLAVRQVVQSLRIQTEESGLQFLFGGSHLTMGVSVGTVIFVLSSIVVVTFATAVTTLGSRLQVSPVAALRETE